MKRFAAFLLVFAGILASVMAQSIVVSSQHPNGIYTNGEPIRWNVRVKGDQKTPSVDYVLKLGGRSVLRKGSLDLQNNAGVLEYTLDKPGAVLAEVFPAGVTDKAKESLGGAIVAPDQITPAAPCPEDFDAFWKSKLTELAAVPPNPHLEEAPSLKTNVDYWKITLDNIRGTHVRGQLARPAGVEKLPALLIVQYAGVYPLHKDWATDRAAQGWLVLNIEAHDIPIDQPQSYYDAQKNGPLNNYPAIGNDNRDTSYFLRMYLGCYQSVEYLASRPDWDGKTIVVMGASQGGMQTLVTAALHPKVTAALAVVPAGCDLLGPQVGRAPGWPQWYSQVGHKDSAKVYEAALYYDVVDFAHRISCPTLIGGGLIDETSPPSGIAAAFNQMHCPKELVLLPRSTHKGEGDTQAAYNRRQSYWLSELRAGRVPTIKTADVQ